MHVSVINAVLYAGRLGSVAHGTVDSKSSCKHGQSNFIPGIQVSGHLRREVLCQVVPVRSTSDESHHRAELIASVKPRHDTGPVCPINRLSQPITPDQNFLSPAFEAESNESKHFDKKSEQEYNKAEIFSMSPQTLDAEDCKDFALEQEIRESVLLLHCMCTARPASHLAFMMHDFRAVLYRSNINSMFFARHATWNHLKTLITVFCQHMQHHNSLLL